MQIFAPAKINLSLEVRGKRPDGFHEIETLMCPISLYDKITVADGGQFSFRCSDPHLPVDETNLVVRAARAFFGRAGLPEKIAIQLEKGIPHGAGLGGGSSDAASTLLALDRHFSTQFGMQTLCELAATLGSDVPFFLYRSAAICRGRGEIVEPVASMPSMDLVLLKPPFGVPTPWAYRQWRDSAEIPGVPYGPQTFPWGRLVNDLERPVFEKYLLLAAMKQWLLAQGGVRGALMSGSGSTMFALVENRAIGEALADAARAEFGETLWTHVCRTGEAKERLLEC